jgi:hypothetical protein
MARFWRVRRGGDGRRGVAAEHGSVGIVGIRDHCAASAPSAGGEVGVFDIRAGELKFNFQRAKVGKDS